ncbi:MAG: leucine-rich repeat domain-containing protein, partial [Bacteroidota bacterium]
MSTIPPIIQQLQQALPKLEIQHLPDIEGFMKSYYPQSYLDVMTPMEEMVGTVYSKSAFTDEGGNLIGLNLFDCDLTDEDLKALEGIDMSHLQTINLSKNQITYFDFSKDFSSIVVANLSENEQLKNVGIHRNCAQLARLEIFDAHLQRLYLPETLHRLFYVDVSKNAQLEEVVFAGGLNFLQVLLLRGTAIKEIEFPGSFPELVFLYLNNNQLEKLSIEQPMPKLRTLQLKENKFLDFSERCLDLGTKQIKNSEFWATFQSFFPRTEAIFFGGNPVQAAELATKLEDEKASNNIQTLEAHYKQRGGGTKEDDECKVILIGNGSAGKTSI